MKISRPGSAIFLPSLFSLNAKGELQRWRVWASDGIVFTEFGLDEGKMQKTVGKKAVWTNEGRSNERSPAEQAVFEAEALWHHKLERKYRVTREEAKKPILLPMLAQDYWRRPKGKPPEPSPAAKKLVYPVFVQRKLNGLRCVARWVGDELLLVSRGGKLWELDHIKKAVRRILPYSMALDGELYIHGVPLQTITSLAKDPRPESDNLEFHVYDLVNFGEPKADQTERFDQLEMVIEKSRDHCIVLCPTEKAKSGDELREFERIAVEDGYEGIMIRARDGTYRWKVRSPKLLKFKSFMDAEFVVLGCLEGKGKFVGCPRFVCRNDTNAEIFKVSPRGSMEERRTMFRERKKYIGKKLTVRFADRYEDTDLPQFPVGIAFRDRKDLP